MTLPPLSGSPAAVRLLADRLAATAERLAAMAGVLVRLRDEAVWDGPAGRSFGARVGAVPAVLDAAARRQRGAVGPLRAFATALEEAQAVTATAQREEALAEDEYRALEEHAWSLVSSGATEGDPALLAVRAGQREAEGTAQRARARHAAAVREYRAADLRCSAVLRALVDDGLADGWGYRALTGAARAGHDLGALGAVVPVAPELGPMAVAGDGLGAVGDLALLVGYGEGSWRHLTVSAAGTATAFAGRSLVAGAAAGARVGAQGVQVLGRLSARERVVLGSVEEARRRARTVREAFAVPPARSTPSALLGGPPLRTAGLARRVPVAARLRAAADARFLDDWRLATANGARPMYVTGVTLQCGAAAGQRAAGPRPDHR